MASKKTVKEVTFIARIEFKCDHRKVVYLARSSNGVDQYETSLFDGKATGCSCPSRKPCKHMKAAEQKEAARQETAQKFAAQTMPAWIMNLVNTGKLETPAKVEKTETIVEAPVKVEAPVVPTYTNMFKKPWNKIAKQREQCENRREILAEAREIKGRRDLGERGNLNTGRAFSLMR